MRFFTHALVLPLSLFFTVAAHADAVYVNQVCLTSQPGRVRAFVSTERSGSPTAMIPVTGQWSIRATELKADIPGARYSELFLKLIYKNARTRTGYPNDSQVAFKFKVDFENGSPHLSTISAEVTDLFGKKYKGDPYKLSLDCAPHIQSHVNESGTLSLDLMALEALYVCMNDDGSGEFDILNPTLIGKRQVLDGKVGTTLIQERQTGDAAAAEIEARLKAPILPVDHPITVYAQSVLDRIVASSDLPLSHAEIAKPVLKVIDSDTLNAFALPGGRIYIYRKMIESTRTESELAAVLAHEWAHVVAKHGSQKMKLSSKLGIGSTILYAIFYALSESSYIGEESYNGGKLRFTEKYGKQILIGAVAIWVGYETFRWLYENGFSRKREAESDLLGLQYLWNAGYDPNGAVGLFEVFENESASVAALGYFGSHPLSKKRIASMAVFTDLFLPLRHSYPGSSAEYLAVKKMLSEMPPAPKRGAKQLP